jgi:hypothetical protein
MSTGRPAAHCSHAGSGPSRQLLAGAHRGRPASAPLARAKTPALPWRRRRQSRPVERAWSSSKGAVIWREPRRPLAWGWSTMRTTRPHPFPSSGARDLPTHSPRPTAWRASFLARVGTAAVLGDGLSSEQAGGVDAVDEPDPPQCRSARPRKRARSSATARPRRRAGGRSMSYRLGAAGAAAPGGRPSVSAGTVRGKCIDRRPQALVVKAAGRAAA